LVTAQVTAGNEVEEGKGKKERKKKRRRKKNTIINKPHPASGTRN